LVTVIVISDNDTNAILANHNSLDKERNGGNQKGQVKDEALCRGVEPRFRATIIVTGACTNRYTNRELITECEK